MKKYLKTIGRHDIYDLMNGKYAIYTGAIKKIFDRLYKAEDWAKENAIPGDAIICVR